MSLGEWQGEWDATVERVESTRLEDISVQECEDVLAFLRTRRPELSPPPLGDLQEPVDSWFNLAEGVFFECEFPEAELQSMETLESEVDAVLELEG